MRLSAHKAGSCKLYFSTFQKITTENFAFFLQVSTCKVLSVEW